MVIDLVDANRILEEGLMNKLTIKFYQVKCGDCIYIRYTLQDEVINIATSEEKEKYNFDCIYAQSNSNCLKAHFENGILNFE